MQVEITPAVEWKLNHAVEAMTGAAEDVARYSFDRRVTIFVEQWEERIESEGQGWTDSALKRRTASDDQIRNEGESNTTVPEFDGENRSPNIESAVVRRVEAIAAAENPHVPVGQLSFNDMLLVALEAWNAYGQEVKKGWKPADPRFPSPI